MSEQQSQNGYDQNQDDVNIAEKVEQNNDEIQKIFNEMAEKNDDVQGFQEPVITTGQAQVLVDEMEGILDVNCDVAKAYFFETHDDYPKNFGDTNGYMEYPTYKRILIQSVDEQLEFEKKYKQEQQQGQNSDQEQDYQDNSPQNQQQDQQQQQNQFQDDISQNQNTNPQEQNQVDDLYKPQQSHYENDPDSNIYTRHNNMIYGNFIHSHNKELLDYFTDFSKEEGEPKVIGQDIPLIMRVAFYIDNITFHKTKEDPEEFFNKDESYKIVISQMDQYLTQQDGIDTTTIDVSQFKFSFIQFLDFVEYFLQHEPDIFLRRTDNEDHEVDQTLQDAQGQTELEAELRQNIAKYENLLDEAKTENERIVINNMLGALYNQLSKIESIKEPILGKKQKRKLTKEENRKKNLNEIFLFYCKQQYTQAPKYSFDRLLYESHTMNMSNFLLFSKQFKITNYCLKLTKKMLPGLFKRTSANYRDLTFQEFQVLLEKIALLMFEGKEDLPTEFDKIEAFYKYIEVDNPNFFRKHMNLLNPPFNIQDPIGFRHLPKDKDRNIEVKKIPPKLQMELDKRKKEREMLVQKFTAMTPQAPPSRPYQSKSIGNINNYSQVTTSRPPFQPKNFGQKHNYSTKNHQRQLSKLNLNNKVSWQQLERISYSDMKQIQQNSSFKPTDLFDDKVDNEDREYLRQYDLEEEKQKKLDLSYIHKKEQESYGNLKNPLRPTQKYLLKHDPNYSEKGYQHSNVHRSHLDDTYNNPYQYYSPQPQAYQKTGYGQQTKNQISQNYLQRAQQIDQYQRTRENQQLQQMMTQNDKSVQRGMYAAKK